MNNKTDLRTPDFFGDSTELRLRLNCEDQFTYYLGLYVFWHRLKYLEFEPSYHLVELKIYGIQLLTQIPFE